MDEWLRDNNHILRDMNQIMKTVEFVNKNSANAESCKVWEMTNLHQENAWEALGKPEVLAGGMLAPDRHKLNLIFLWILINYVPWM